MFSSVMDAAAQKGDLALVMSLKTKQHQWTTQTFKCATSSGNLDLVKWMRIHKCPFDHHMAHVGAISSGNLQMVEWVLTPRVREWNNFWRYKFEAIKYGHLHILKWYYDNYHYDFIYDGMHQTLNFAIEYGRDDILNWLFSIGERHLGLPLNDSAVETIVRKNYIYILEWIKQNIDRRFSIEADNKSISVLTWLQDNNCLKLTPTALTNAAKNNQPDTVKWLVSHGCKLQTRDIEHAALNDNVPLLHWMISQGCTADFVHLFRICLQSHSLIVSQWLIQSKLLSLVEVTHGDWSRYVWYIDPDKIPTKSRFKKYCAMVWLQSKKILTWEIPQKQWIQAIDTQLALVVRVTDLEHLIKSYI